MKRTKRLCLLLGVLVLVCAAAFLALHAKEAQEQIKETGEVVLEIDSSAVDAVSWENETASLAFHKDGTWLYDDDAAFPVNQEKMGEMLDQFSAFAAAFTIEHAEDLSQYGLDDPVCAIHLAAGDQTWEIALGSFSSMDSKRYVSVGDGNVYLAQNDPLDLYSAELSDMIQNDSTPALDTVSAIRFSGRDSYEVSYEEDSPDTYCGEDVYFADRNGKHAPLDTGRVEDYLGAVSSLDLTNYVTYNASQEDLETYGLDSPELTVSVDYTSEDADGNDASGTLTLHISRDPEELAAAEDSRESETADPGGSEEDSGEGDSEEEEITAFARVGDSPILYQIDSLSYTDLMQASYNDLRHREVLSADFADVTGIDAVLDGASYSLTSEGEGEDRAWSYNGTELEDITDLQNALTGLSADSFTEEAPGGKEEISLTVHLDNENFPEVKIALYRYDGANCLAVVDGEPVSLVPRTGVVSLAEAVNAIVLN